MSPSKAFNMPGLSASHALIFNEDLRKRFRIYISLYIRQTLVKPLRIYMDAGELDMGHVFAFLSVEAAYSPGILKALLGDIKVTEFIRAFSLTVAKGRCFS